MNKKHLKFLAIIVLVILGTCVWFFCNKNITIKEDDICIGTIHYSYMLGIDAGTEYSVSIYYKDENTYKYEVTEKKITIDGYKTEDKKVNGIISSKYDLIKLDEKYKNKKYGNLEELYIKYNIRDKGQVKDINDFIEEVFNYKDEETKKK